MYYCNILAHQVQYYCTIAVNNLLVVPETPISPAQWASSLIVIARLYTREEHLTFWRPDLTDISQRPEVSPVLSGASPHLKARGAHLLYGVQSDVRPGQGNNEASS